VTIAAENIFLVQSVAVTDKFYSLLTLLHRSEEFLFAVSVEEDKVL